MLVSSITLIESSCLTEGGDHSAPKESDSFAVFCLQPRVRYQNSAIGELEHDLRRVLVYSLIQSTKHLPRTYYVPNIVVVDEDIEINLT